MSGTKKMTMRMPASNNSGNDGDDDDDDFDGDGRSDVQTALW